MSNAKKFFNQRTIFLTITLTFVFLYIFINSFYCTGWKYAAFLAFGVWLVLLTYSLLKKDRLVLVFLGMATIAGLVELAADNWLVNGIQKLTYQGGEPWLVASPIYMPFAWAVVLTQIGFIGWKLSNRWGLLKASLFTAFIGGLIIPFYEHCAKGACWWVYTDWQHEWWNTPYFIVLGEALLMLPIPFALRRVATKKPIRMVSWGIVCGLWIWGSYALAYRWVG